MTDATTQRVDQLAHRHYIAKVINALNTAGIVTPDHEIQSDDPRTAFIQLGEADPDTGREVYLCWTEESGWYHGIDKTGSGELSLIRWAHLDLLPAPAEVVEWAQLQEISTPAAGQFDRPHYRSFDDLADGFEAELADAGDVHPELIDLNSGTIYTWTYQANGTGLAGYANADDADFTWTRDALENESSLQIVEYASLDHATIARLATEKGWS